MKTLQFRTLIILLTAGLGTTTAWSGQDVSTTSATASQATLPKGATGQSGNSARAAGGIVPGILSAEEIPAYLLTDPCDTTDY